MLTTKPEKEHCCKALFGADIFREANITSYNEFGPKFRPHEEHDLSYQWRLIFIR
jgi:hypothetical protein